MKTLLLLAITSLLILLQCWAGLRLTLAWVRLRRCLLLLAVLVSLGSVCLAADQQQIVVNITDAKGLPVVGAQAVAILKSGAYQDCKCDPADGQFKCQPTEACVKIYAAAPGFEASCTKYSGAAGAAAVAMKQNPGKSSAIIKQRGTLPGVEGDVNPVIDKSNKLYLYSNKIGVTVNGKAIPQPVPFSLNRAIECSTSSGTKFKLWFVDSSPQVFLANFTTPN